ncbi:MAG: RNA polymerase sigma-70 factor [Cyclobacteriaceae bacterium]|uniref:RNA polymerase sigma factor n=1 Tax=Reichenbachiella sp. TaxID=2184521 RepID=UPI0032664378
MSKEFDHIILELSEGSEAAFKAVYDRYHKNIYGFCINNGQSPEDAEEVLQEVFIKLWVKRDSIDLSKKFDSFLYSIARNIIIDKYRRLVREKAANDYQIHFLNPENNTENTVLYNDLQSEIQRTFNSMPKLRKLVFQMSRFKGYSNKEIAEELGITTKAVENHISRALQAFRKELGNYSASMIYLMLLVELSISLA